MRRLAPASAVEFGRAGIDGQKRQFGLIDRRQLSAPVQRCQAGGPGLPNAKRLRDTTRCQSAGTGATARQGAAGSLPEDGTNVVGADCGGHEKVKKVTGTSKDTMLQAWYGAGLGASPLFQGSASRWAVS